MEPRPNQEWLYRASTSKEGLEATRALIQDYGFICRSAFVDAEKEQMIPHVGQVAFGDLIHVYFVDGRVGVALGAYRVVGPHNHPRPELFAAGVKRALTLRTVAAGELADKLSDCKGYESDPRLAAYCGWPVVPGDQPSPIYSRARFPGRSSIAPYPALRRSR